MSCRDVTGKRERENALMNASYENRAVHGNPHSGIRVAPFLLPAYGSAIWVSNIG
jgi:hypothetical protein